MRPRGQTSNPPRSRAWRGWLGGAAAGFVLGCGLTAGAQDKIEAKDLVTPILYAISALAVDTETNAARIEALSQKIDDLEEQLKASAAK